MSRSDRKARALIALLLLAIHLLLLHMLWRQLHPDRPALPHASRASLTVVVLAPPVAAPEPSPDPARRRLARTPVAPARKVHAPEAVYADEVPQGVVAVSAAPVPAMTASEGARPLRLDEKTIRQAIADAKKGGFRGMVKSAGRLDDIEPQRPNPVAKAVSGAAKPGWRAMAEGRIASAKVVTCRPARGAAQGLGGAAEGIGGAAGAGGGIGGPALFPFTTSNPNDCKK